jgi:spore maturation protein CgeB/SAM-dependent methyltransferase
MLPELSSNFEDRISEVYYGSLSSERLTKRARDRIHWMCQSAVGKKVLDVGCSQGIASILLGREGYEVVGIDTSSAAIEFANKDLGKEAADVQARVTFLEADLFSYDKTASFNTVILGEVIEHMMDPLACLQSALVPLRVGGKVVLTTPFGYAPHDDHKSTMFLSWLLQLADLSVRVDTCEIVDGYIKLVLTKLAEGKKSSLPGLGKLLRATEAGTLNSQRRLHAMIDQRQEEIERLRVMQESVEATNLLPEQIQDLRRSMEELRKFRSINKLEAELSDAKSRESLLTILSNDVKSAVREVESSQREVKELRNSVSFAVGSELVNAFRRPYRLPLLPVLMLRSARRAIAARREAPADVCERLETGASVLQVDTKGITIEQDTIADQAYELSIDVVGEAAPCRKGILLEVILDEDELEGFLQRNAGFRRRSAAGTAFTYLDLTGAAAQQTSVIIWTGMRSRATRFSLTRFRGTDPITVIVRALRPIDAAEARAKETGHKRLEARPKVVPRSSMEVLSILDPFTESCLEPEVELIPVSKSDWRREVDGSDAKLLFVESAWRGNGGEWNYALTKPEKHGRALKDLIDYCASRDIPSLFWNKEDPANFDEFIDVAAWFDLVFTTDAGSVDNYKRIIQNENVFVLPFAAQTSMHNPVRTGETIPRIAFTGSWRGKKYPARAQWIETLLDPLAEADVLDIFDRFAGTTDNPDLIFPPSLQPAIRGALPYRDLVEQVYKRYAAFVNVNSVETSDTMLARRVFEILACGAPVISSPSPAMERIFGDVVLTPATKSDALEAGQRLLSDLVFREDLASRGVRLVHSDHTYAHRMGEVCERAGLPYIARKPKLVSAICVSYRPEFLDHVHAQLARQNHDHIELIFVQNSSAFSEEEIAARFSDFDLKLLSVPEEQFLADGLNAAIKVANGEYLAKIDDDDYYGANYLSDALLAFDYAPAAGVVGKNSFFAYVEAMDQTVLRFPDKSYRFCRHVHGGTLVWDRRKLDGLDFKPVQRGTDTWFLESVRSRGVRIFSTDPFNFVHVRYADKSRHTWTIEDEEFVSKAIKVGAGLREELALN